MTYSRTEIPKDCCLCDVCNKQLTDNDFIVLEDCFWHVGWLYCNDCEKRFKPTMELIFALEKGDNVLNTDLAKPIVFEEW